MTKVTKEQIIRGSVVAMGLVSKNTLVLRLIEDKRSVLVKVNDMYAILKHRNPDLNSVEQMDYIEIGSIRDLAMVIPTENTGYIITNPKGLILDFSSVITCDNSNCYPYEFSKKFSSLRKNNRVDQVIVNILHDAPQEKLHDISREMMEVIRLHFKHESSNPDLYDDELQEICKNYIDYVNLISKLNIDDTELESLCSDMKKYIQSTSKCMNVED